MASGTPYDFSFPKVKPILTLDDSEYDDIKQSNDSKSYRQVCLKRSKRVSLPSYTPQNVLLGSILEHLCSLYESDTERASKLFITICKQLESIQILSPVAYLEEYASVRLQYKSAFYSLIQSTLLNLDDSAKLPLPSARHLGSNLVAQKPFSTNSASVSPDQVFNLSRSRYREEYHELEPIGKGAFGDVVKARSKLDGQHYAVKKIHLRTEGRGDESPESKRMIREVQSLASLQHEHIVRYHNAWLEHRHVDAISNSGTETSSEKSSAFQNIYSSHQDSLNLPNGFSNIDSNKSFNSNNFVSWDSKDYGVGDAAISARPFSKFFQGSDSDDESSNVSEMSAVETEQCKNLDDDHCDDTFEKMQSSPPSDVILTQGVLHHKRRSDMKRVKSVVFTDIPFTYRNSHHVARSNSCNNMHDFDILLQQNSQRKPIPKVVIPTSPSQLTVFIQMQLCESTLQSWLFDRNNKFNSNVDPHDVIDKVKSIDILHQLLSALDFIHKKDILHRDLKPRNIFINGDRPYVLLGDFGLARSSIARQTSEPFTPVEDVPITFDTEEHTSGVGTTVYAAPEQLGKDSYNFKADMYSVGIIFYELMWPLYTGHERGNAISKLRSGCIPDDYQIKWPSTVKILRSLISHDPEERPSAEQLLNEKIFQAHDKLLISNQAREITNLLQQNAEWERLAKKYHSLLMEHGIDPDAE